MRVVWISWFVCLLTGCTHTVPDSITLATTTSTRDSGLLDVLLPMFESEAAAKVNVVAVGSGQALEMGRRGDVDLLLTHAPEAEADFVEQGFGIDRQAVMHNDFVLVGPPGDQANIREINSVVQALEQIRQRAVVFVSRGDNSGTHMMERNIWHQTPLAPEGDWYLEAGSGMAATLRVASEKEAYTLCDRGTFLAHRGNLRLEILLEGDALLRNEYSVILVSSEKHPHVNARQATRFAAFLLSAKAQNAIKEFGQDRYGQPLFFPDAD